MKEKEEWRKIYPPFDRYSVSNLGNIVNDSTGRILKCVINKSGYRICRIGESPGNMAKSIMAIGEFQLR